MTKNNQNKKPTSVSKVRNSVPKAIINLHCTFNNSIVSLADTEGNIITQSSAGACGFKSSKKSTAFALQAVLKIIFDAVDRYKVKNISCIRVKGTGAQIEQGITTILIEANKRKINATKIQDVTCIPFNGTRPKKIRKT